MWFGGTEMWFGRRGWDRNVIWEEMVFGRRGRDEDVVWWDEDVVWWGGDVVWEERVGLRCGFGGEGGTEMRSGRSEWDEDVVWEKWVR